MEINEVEKRDGAKAILNVIEEREYIHSDYDLVLSGGQITPTGLLTIAVLRVKKPKIGSLCEFIMRWDDKDDCLDIDSLSENQKEQRLFISGTEGYFGHHSAKISGSPRIFEVNLMWQKQLVYHGRFKFGLSVDLSCKDDTILGDNIS